MLPSDWLISGKMDWNWDWLWSVVEKLGIVYGYVKLLWKLINEIN